MEKQQPPVFQENPPPIAFSPLNPNDIPAFPKQTYKNSKSPLTSYETEQKINEKFYPQKRNIFKENPSHNIPHYMKPLNSSNSPIVDYFSNVGSTMSNKNYNYFSPDISYNNNLNTNYYSRTNPIHESIPGKNDIISPGELSQNFNMSPGQLFNPVFKDKDSSKNGSIDHIHNGNGDVPLQKAFVSSALQKQMGKSEEIVSNDFHNINDNSNDKEDKKEINVGKSKTKSIGPIKEEGEYYMLDFDSDDNDDEDNEPKDEPQGTTTTTNNDKSKIINNNVEVKEGEQNTMKINNNNNNNNNSGIKNNKDILLQPPLGNSYLTNTMMPGMIMPNFKFSPLGLKLPFGFGSLYGIGSALKTPPNFLNKYNNYMPNMQNQQQLINSNKDNDKNKNNQNICIEKENEVKTEIVNINEISNEITKVEKENTNDKESVLENETTQNDTTTNTQNQKTKKKKKKNKKKKKATSTTETKSTTDNTTTTNNTNSNNNTNISNNKDKTQQPSTVKETTSNNNKKQQTSTTSSTNVNNANPSSSTTTTTSKKKKNKKIKKIDPSTYINANLDYLCENILPLAKDQAGCRHIQSIIDSDPHNTTQKLFKAILPNFIEISLDTFGNYLIQKLFPQLSPSEILQVINTITPVLVELGSDAHGTRVIQHLINFLSTDSLLQTFLSVIKPVTIPLIKELNGTHIIQKIADDFPSQSEFIYELILKNAPSIATHRHGCCVLQRYLVNREDSFCKQLIEKLDKNFFLLAVDQFGNYIIQSIMKLNDQQLNDSFAMKMIDNIIYYSKHKFSSNIVEKCFDYCSEDIKTKLITILSEEEAIKELIIDEHGNYVVQKVLSCSTKEKRSVLFNYIIPLISKINNMSFGEKIISRLTMMYPSLISLIEKTGVNIPTTNANIIKTNNSNNNSSNNNNNDNYYTSKRSYGYYRSNKYH